MLSRAERETERERERESNVKIIGDRVKLRNNKKNHVHRVDSTGNNFTDLFVQPILIFNY